MVNLCKLYISGENTSPARRKLLFLQQNRGWSADIDDHTQAVSSLKIKALWHVIIIVEMASIWTFQLCLFDVLSVNIFNLPSDKQTCT